MPGDLADVRREAVPLRGDACDVRHLVALGQPGEEEGLTVFEMWRLHVLDVNEWLHDPCASNVTQI